MPNDSDDRSERIQLTKREFLGTAVGVAALGSQGAGADGDSPDDQRNDNPNGDGGEGPSLRDGDDGNPTERSVTLLTGETIYITIDGRTRTYAVDGADDPDGFRIYETDRGTYFLPTRGDIRKFEEELFNVDRLIADGLTDDETETIPVLLEAGTESQPASTETLRSTVESTGAVGTKRLKLADSVAAEVPKADTATISSRMATQDEIDRVLLDKRYEPTLDTSAEAIRAEVARQEFEVDGTGIDVGIIDSGIDDTHPDLQSRVVDRNNFTGDPDGDQRGHGTHVAGIVAGEGTESDGTYTGIAPGANLIDLKVFGLGRISTIIEAVEYAVSQDLDIINLSLGGDPSEESPLDRAINNANAEGVVPIVSAGNNGERGEQTLSSPGTAPGAITVAATDHRESEPEIAFFSSRGPTPFEYRLKPDVAAPGVQVTSTGSQDASDIEYPYDELSGTSMASPMVAGVAALLLEAAPELGPEAVRTRLVSTCNSLGESAIAQGAGEVDARAALDNAISVSDPIVDFGKVTTTEADARTVELTLENNGAQSRTLELEPTVSEFFDGTDATEHVSLDSESVSLDPGQSTTIELTVDTDSPHGIFTGDLRIRSDAETHHVMFGWVRVAEYVFSRTVHPDEQLRDEYGNIPFTPSLNVASRDEDLQYSAPAAFDPEADQREIHTVNAFTDEATVAVHSDSRVVTETTPDGKTEELSHIFETTVTETQNVVHIDHSTVEPRKLDVDTLPDPAPYHVRRRGIGLNDLETDFAPKKVNLGPDVVNQFHLNAIAKDDPFTLNLFHLLAPETYQDWDPEPGGSQPLLRGSDVGYYFSNRTDRLPADSSRIDPPELTELVETHYRFDESVAPVVAIAIGTTADDYVDYRGATSWYGAHDPDLLSRTWYVNEAETEYHWLQYEQDLADWMGPSSEWGYEMLDFCSPETSTTHVNLGHEPVMPHVTEWTIEDDTLRFSWVGYADQPGPAADASMPRFAVTPAGVWEDSQPFSIEVSVNDEVTYTAGDVSRPPTIFESEPISVTSDDTVRLESTARMLEGTRRGTVGELIHETTIGTGDSDRPPSIESMLIPALTRYNELHSGQTIATVDLQDVTGELSTVRAKYAPASAVSSLTDDGWKAADVVYREESTVAVRYDTSTMAGQSLAFGFEFEDAAGDYTGVATIDVIPVIEWASESLPVELGSTRVSVAAGETLSLTVSPTDSVTSATDIDRESLAVGAPELVYDGDGASPTQVSTTDAGGLELTVPTTELGLSGKGSPTPLLVTGLLDDDETRFSGSGLLDSVHTPADYIDASGTIPIGGLRDAVADWRAEDITTPLLRRVVEIWQSNEQVK